ncbi:cell division ATP-binding protein FtsE [Irregularibacter muris]|uniref:Cell division ATP-binding protein FtsE n=1 Tax=Irregularibacter muris TaxID=1796619 RepID=A0AAE3HH87_9FIRM|nr:cell division ATP-binding protein FtsE [Irregularibacter muris]MCR1899083.1 cell division ATP-binding protein FtsE [Irregularibacter muris]
MIEMIDISKEYKNGHKALKNINIYIEKGEFVFIVGASGAGKSTFIKLLLKEENPTAGKILLDDRDITYLRQREIPYLRRNIGVVFQDFRLLPNKTVYENIAFAMEIIEEHPKNISKQVPMILSMVGLSERANNYPDQLSGGEQQRVALARAIVNKPKFLICDEPTGNLDPKTAQGIMDVLYKINYSGTTIIMATHAKEIVNEAKKRVVILSNGEIVSDQQKGVYDHEN